MKKLFNQQLTKADKYLKDVNHFIQIHEMISNKILSFHLNEVSCFTKGKLGKRCGTFCMIYFSLFEISKDRYKTCLINFGRYIVHLMSASSSTITHCYADIFNVWHIRKKTESKNWLLILLCEDSLRKITDRDGIFHFFIIYGALITISIYFIGEKS